MTVKQKDNGKWEAAVRKRGVEGSYKATFDTEVAAVEAESFINGQLAAGKTMEQAKELLQASSRPQGATLRDLYRLTVQEVWRTKSGAQQDNADLIIGEFLGWDTLISSINATKVSDMEAFYRDVKKNAESTVNKKKSALRTMFKVAVEFGWIKEIPRIKHTKEHQNRRRTLTDDEEGKLLRLTAQLYPGFEEFWIACLDTGARTGEVRMLPKANREGDHIHILRTKTETNSILPLTDRLKAILDAREDTESDYYFPEATKGHVRHVWDNIKSIMGLAEDTQFVPYSLRHSCCTRLIKGGVQLPVVKTWMGHSRIETTMSYIHVNATMLDASVSVLNDHNGRS